MNENFGSRVPCVCGFGEEFFTMEEGRPICTVCGGMVGKFQEEQPAAPMEGEKKAVLIVDDQAFFRQRIRHILEEFGHQVLEAADGIEGIRTIAEVYLGEQVSSVRRIDAVILDLIMPGELDGFQTLAVFKSLLPEMPVIILTASPPRKELLDKLARLGARKYLNKSAANLDSLVQKNIEEI